MSWHIYAFICGKRAEPFWQLGFPLQMFYKPPGSAESEIDKFKWMCSQGHLQQADNIRLDRRRSTGWFGHGFVY